MSLPGKPGAEAAAGVVERLLVVTSGPMTVALPEPIVEDILPPEESGAAVVVTDREVTYRVRDLASRLGQTPAAKAPDPRVLLCGRGDRHQGFRVDRVLGPTEVDPRSIRPLPPHFTGEERTWIKGFFTFQNTIAVVVDPDWLLGDDADADTPGPPTDTKRAAASGQGAVLEMEVVDAEGTA